MRQLLFSFIILSLILSGCDRTTPPEMLFGNWKVNKIIENGHNVTELYVDKTSGYLKLDESGIYQIGLVDSSDKKNWIIYPETNELVLLDGGIIDKIKKWDVVASDNQIELHYKTRGIRLILDRVDKLPTLAYRTPEDLVGKWVVEKVTINGSNSTSNYAYLDRWIILAENGRFYNGQNDGDQNSGFWKANESLTEIEFRADQKDESPALSFHVTNEMIWYQKEQNEYEKHRVRIYFKKEDS